MGTFFISALLIALFGGSFFFTSVPRGSVEELAARHVADDPNAPTQSFARRWGGGGCEGVGIFTVGVARGRVDWLVVKTRALALNYINLYDATRRDASN